MPGLSDHLVAALDVPGEHIIDPWSAPLGYITQALALGAELLRNAEVLSGEFDGAWHLETTAGPILAASIVNAAGLYGDIVDARLGLVPDFTIKPRKGQFVVLDKTARRHVPRIVLPVPTETTKGIVVCPTAFGNVLIGPTAEEQDDRERATVETEALEALLARGRALVPALASISVTAAYAGLRPASEKKHYRICARPDRRAITLGGVRSTGLSAALGLAQHAVSLHESFGTQLAPPAAVPDVTMPNLTENCERDWQRADHGEIICHCELVTRREIEATFASPVPPGDFGGLRRRTRAGMGRCQGFYCNARLAAITRDRLAVPLRSLGRPQMSANESIGRPYENDRDADAIVIGGGPAGVAAALELKEHGVARVTIVEREPVLGGAPRHCAHSPFGMREFGRIYFGPAYARRLQQQARDAGIDIRTGHSVVELGQDGTLLVTSARGVRG